MAQKWRRMAQASTKAARPGKRQTSSTLICKTATLHVQHAFLVSVSLSSRHGRNVKFHVAWWTQI